MLQGSQFESRTDEAVNMFTHNQTHESIHLAETANKRGLMSKRSEEMDHSIYSQSQSPRDMSQHLRELGTRLSLSPSHKSKSQRNASQPLSLTSSLLEQPQLLAMQTSGHQRDDQSTSMLSYASLPLGPGQLVQHDYIQSDGMLLPSTSRTASDNQTEILKHPLQDPVTEQPQAHQAAANSEDNTSAKAALSSVSRSPRRSISRDDSRSHRRKRESVAVPQHQITCDHFVSPFVGRQQPRNLVTGDFGEISGMSSGQSADRTRSSRVSQSAQAMLLVNPPPTRTLDSVRHQVATEIAYRALSKSDVVDGELTSLKPL